MLKIQVRITISIEELRIATVTSSVLASLVLVMNT